MKTHRARALNSSVIGNNDHLKFSKFLCDVSAVTSVSVVIAAEWTDRRTQWVHLSWMYLLMYMSSMQKNVQTL